MMNMCHTAPMMWQDKDGKWMPSKVFMIEQQKNCLKNLETS